MAARKDNLAPYEVMRQPAGTPAGRTGAVRAGEREPVLDKPTEEAGAGTSTGLGGLLQGPRQPLILRVPKGYIAVAGVLLASVVVLAYWSGRSIGYRAGLREASERFEAIQPGGLWELGDEAASGTSSGQSSAELGSVHGTLVQRPTAGQDPRKVGLNYWVLAHYRQAEAQRLLGFLWNQGVEAAAFARHNEGLFQVVALRGFAPGELNEPAETYRRQLLALGRVWKDKHRGSDLARNGIYLDKYEGESATAMIVRAR